MSLQAFQGKDGLRIRGTHIASIKIATPGFPITNASGSHESNPISWRAEGTEIVIKQVSGKDAVQREFAQNYEVAIKIVMLQTDLPALKNFYKLSRVGCQLIVTLLNGDILNFTDNTGTVAAPEGSTLLGMTTTFSLDSKKRELELMLDGILYPETYNWLIDNTGAAETGGSGGVSLGLTAMVYDRTKQRRSNFTDVKVDAVSVGYIKDDAKITIKSGGNKVSPGQTYSEWWDVDGEVMMRQSMPEEIKAAIDFATADRTIEFFNVGGDTIKIVSPGASFEEHQDDKEPGIKLKISGRLYANADEATPNRMDYGVTSATVLQLNVMA